ncbi:EamA family transporter [Pseudoalteromonas denitrificans]|uniref:EamA-like transporter family protein n=1 Tax=Pseudoalteromonas denitrificans DSM 6059 TaxID=1123010 RepID=A0A1I1N2J2_9GAMM|nr:EamA family transporter [Pseudoalteromonas denitrificans]SFC91566.1 EamA-like transporter family protein [Pseudoalteromonas denitrificans DSM 6059]
MNTFYGINAIFMWGALALLGTLTISIPPLQLLSLCFFISWTLMFIKRALTKEPLLIKPCLTFKQWFIGIAALFSFHFCYFMALKIAPAIEVSLISYLWPMLLAILVSPNKMKFQSLIGGFIGFIGVGVIIMGNTKLSLKQEYMPGYILALSCAIIWTGYSWYLSKSKNKVDDIGWLSLGVALLSFIAHLILETSLWQFNAKLLLGIILLGLGPVGGAFYLWDLSLKKGNKSLLASLSFMAPLISSLLLSLFGISQWSINIVIALIFIITGALISNKMDVLKHKLINARIAK